MAATMENSLLTDHLPSETKSSPCGDGRPALYSDSAPRILISFDCNACALSTLKVAEPVSMVPAVIQIHPHMQQARLPGNKMVVYTPASSMGAIVLNEAAQRILAAFSTPQPLQQAADVFVDMPVEVLRHTVETLVRFGVLCAYQG